MFLRPPNIIGLNISHPISRGAVSAISVGSDVAGGSSSQRNYVNGQVCTSGGTISLAKDPYLGVVCTGSNLLGPTTTVSAPQEMTLVVYGVCPAVNTIWADLNSGSYRIANNASGNLRLTLPGVVDIDSTLAVTATAPYCIAVSRSKAAGKVNFVTMRLDSGQIQWQSGASAGTAAAGGATSGIVANNQAAYVGTFVYQSMGALLGLMQDPWSLFWEQEDFEPLFALLGSFLVTVTPDGAWGEAAWGRRAWGLPPMVAGGVNTTTAVFRRTLSAVGTRIGSRQIHK